MAAKQHTRGRQASGARSTRTWTRRAGRVAAGLGLAAGGGLLGALGVAYFVAEKVTAPIRPGFMDAYVMTPFETGADYQDVRFAPEHGAYTLEGWWLSRPESQQVIIACTGYRGTKSSLIGISTALWRAGFNVLMFDYHGHGAGQGARVTLGYRELQDFYGALTYVRQRMPAAQIAVIGYSMGASIAIMGSARRPEVCAIVADSPFATHAEVLAYNISRVLHVSGRPFTALADHFIFRRAGYRGSDVTPVHDVAAIAPRPLLLIHGTADTLIPVEHGKQVFDAAREPKELWLGEGAEHCGTYFLNRPLYCARVTAFFKQGFDAARASDDAARSHTGTTQQDPMRTLA